CSILIECHKSNISDFKLNAEAEFPISSFQNFKCTLGNFRTDAVTGQNENFHGSSQKIITPRGNKRELSYQPTALYPRSLGRTRLMSGKTIRMMISAISITTYGKDARTRSSKLSPVTRTRA